MSSEFPTCKECAWLDVSCVPLGYYCRRSSTGAVRIESPAHHSSCGHFLPEVSQ